MRTEDTPLPVTTTDERLARATEDNLFALFTAMARGLPGGELDRGPGLWRHHSSPTNPMFKGVWDVRLAPAEVDAAIDDAIAWFRARGAPYFFWWTGPSSAPADLGTRLQERGLLDMAEQQRALSPGMKLTASGAPIMVAQLDRLDANLLERTPPGYRLREVADEASLGQFRDVFVATYQVPAWAGQAWVDATRTIGIGRTPWRMFVGYLDGIPVATNVLFTAGGVASVYGVATLPAAQGKGIGAAITLAPLLAAREAGHRHGVLFSTEKGFKVYQRIGFRDTGTRMNRYLWRSPES
jgi:ribosomal protein S18 acetylase RimI-like enzyme